MTAAAVVLLGGIAYAPEATEGQPATVGTLYVPTDPPEPATVELVTIGDSFTATSRTGARGWPVQVAERVRRPLVNLGVGGSGYVRAEHDSTFPLSVARVPATAAVVVVFGGYNDQVDYLRPAADVAASAAATYASIRAAAPQAQLLVIGPQWPDASPSPTITGYRDVVRAAATEAGATFVDSLGWFAGHPELIGDDGLHPNTGPAQDYLADLITPHVAAALAR